MDVSLNKLPWYAQVGLFVALAVAGVAAFYYLYAIPADWPSRCSSKRSSRRSASTSARAWRSPAAAAVPGAGGGPRDAPRRAASHPARREGLRRSAPQPADAGGAVEPDHQALQARAGGDQGAARRVADQHRARRHVPQPRALLRPHQPLLAHHQHREHARSRPRTSPTRTPASRSACVATTFVLVEPAKTGAAAAKAPAARGAAPAPGGKS